MKKQENIAGFILLFVVLAVGKKFLASDMHFFRLVMGMALGYTLTRAYTGFAGGVNRAFQTGSTKLMRTLMFMFVLSAAVTAGLLVFTEGDFNLWVRPLNFGVVFGGLLFGFGMAFSSCCASGVLTDLITGLPRALVTLIFFSFGVFIGFPLMKQDWVAKSWITSGGKYGQNGVYFPDLFQFDGLNGYLGAMVLTALLAGLVVVISNKYQAKRKREGTYTGHFVEKAQEDLREYDADEDYSFPNEKTYERVFVQAWSLRTGAVVLTILFGILMAATKTGWGASTPYGFWFGKVLNVFGVSGKALADFTKMEATHFTNPFFANPTTVQNFGILFGTAIYLLTAGKFKDTFMSEMSLSFKQALVFALGGLTMGVGTRLSGGCNLGALYTPIANFSLSGWVFLVFMVIGGFVGNVFSKKWDV